MLNTEVYGNIVRVREPLDSTSTEARGIIIAPVIKTAKRAVAVLIEFVDASIELAAIQRSPYNQKQFPSFDTESILHELKVLKSQETISHLSQPVLQQFIRFKV